MHHAGSHGGNAAICENGLGKGTFDCLGSRFGSMTNPTDTGGENPTIRDVRPPSDTCVTAH